MAGHRREMPAWEICLKDLESKTSVVVDVEVQTHSRNKELSIRVVGEETCLSRVGNGRDRVVVAIMGLETRVDGVLARMDGAMRMLQEDIAALFRRVVMLLVRNMMSF